VWVSVWIVLFTLAYVIINKVISKGFFLEQNKVFKRKNEEMLILFIEFYKIQIKQW
jgi:hypothetical protein